ncbi:5'-methylthioadenosine/S-adenosylhomocysteine nucleosidase [Haloglycomyces albus]|uniref:5'-methylthioadenosine/S-adenosylhomocysteine nucleosidase family protein n=1 Tax=Haloglycomyces albus TaxID=526067 RepID=UPI00046D1B09|nr:5'-methylthioadenosine/S-adenosylhomocysteine nucleosidase [Haloglycomyces albus]
MVDIVVLTALNCEFEAVRQYIKEPERYRHDAGTGFDIGYLADSDCRIALVRTGAGNQPAAILAERAVTEFAPRAVFFVGVAGALWDSPGLGDVVVASRVYAYHGGTSEDDGLKARPRVWEAPHLIDQIANEIIRSGIWTERLPPETPTPTAVSAPIAAGEVVQNSRVSREAQWIRRHYNDATAIEMESAGVAQAAHLNSVDIAVVRGISDKADGTKGSDGDVEWQPRAAEHAAMFAVQLAQEYMHEVKDQPMRSRKSDSSPATIHSPHVSNVAHGTVGVQAANITGSTVQVNSPSIGSTETDARTAVDKLRTHLDNNYANGEIDDDVYREAMNEIDTAASGLDNPSAGDKKKSVLALKKLRGLAGETTNVAANIALVITAVNGLS